jgi:adenylylsulfate kinase
MQQQVQAKAGYLEMTDDNLPFVEETINKSLRRQLNGHSSYVIWLTGLSGAGKSTLSALLERHLYHLGIHTYVLDGDNLRKGLNADLGYMDRHRRENIRRVGEVSKVLVDAGIVTIVAVIAPFQADREMVRELMNDGEFIEVYVKCPFEVCAKRDPKGLYQLVRTGVIRNFTGYDSPYEEPVHPEIVVETDRVSALEGTDQIVAYLLHAGKLNQGPQTPIRQ